MSRTTGRRLAGAVECWLQKEFLCFKGGLFGEAYLASIVGEVLTSLLLESTHFVIAGYAHDALKTQGEKKQGGRNREVDFVLQRLHDKRVVLAVECKWAGSSHCKPSEIFNDLLRLEVLSASGIDECYFLLAGPKDKMKTVMSRPPFEMVGEAPLLAMRAGRQVSRVLTRQIVSKLLTKKSTTDAPARRYPVKLLSQQFDSMLRGAEMSEFFAYCWKISRTANKSRPSFDMEGHARALP